MHNFSEKVGFIWGVADLLRGDYKQSESTPSPPKKSPHRLSPDFTGVTGLYKQLRTPGQHLSGSDAG